MASDVFSAGLIVVEMVTQTCVYVHAGDKAAAAAEAKAGAIAKAAARAAATASAKAALVSQATERLQTILAFAQDSPLTLEAMQMLAQACTKDDPADRCTFRDVQQLCKPVGQAGGRGGGGAASGQCNVLSVPTKLLLLLWLLFLRWRRSFCCCRAVVAHLPYCVVCCVI